MKTDEVRPLDVLDRSSPAYPVDFHTTGDIWRPRIPHSTSRGVGLTDMAAHEWIGLVINRVTGKSNELLPGP